MLKNAKNCLIENQRPYFAAFSSSKYKPFLLIKASIMDNTEDISERTDQQPVPKNLFSN